MLLLIILLLGPSTCFAGIDFAMSSQQHYELPLFENRVEAVTWAHKIKWIEPIRRAVKHKIEELRLETSNVNLAVPSGIKRAEYLMTEREYYKTALGIIENYRANNIEGDMAQVGSTFYAGEQPIVEVK